MGAQQTKIQETQISDYEVITTYEDSIFGQISIVQQINGTQKFIQKEYVCFSEDEYLNLKDKIEKQSFWSHPNLMKVIKFSSTKQIGLCSSQFKIYMLYEYFNHNLLQDSMKRREKNFQFYSEDDLWFIIKQTIDGYSAMQSSGLQIGEIRPQNIYVDLDTQKLQIFDISNFNKKSIYLELLSGSTQSLQQIYLSPQQMKALQKQDFKDINIQQSSIFNLGMKIFLKIIDYLASLNENIDKAFDYQNFTINYKLIDKILNSLNGRYSQIIVLLLSKMISKDSYDLDYIQLNNIIKNKHRVIANLVQIKSQENFKSKENQLLDPIDYYSLIKVQQEQKFDQEYDEVKSTKFIQKSIYDNFKLKNINNDPLINQKKEVYLDEQKVSNNWIQKGQNNSNKVTILHNKLKYSPTKHKSIKQKSPLKMRIDIQNFAINY